MTEYRKQWSWPYGLADAVYYKIRKWSNQYDNTGKIHKSKRVPHERFGEEMPETLIQMRVHTLAFTYSEMQWLHKILQTEDKNTTQAHIFARALEIFEEKQATGRAPMGISLPFDFALTKDEVGYLRMLLECIGKYRKPTPSERKRQSEINKEGIDQADW